MDISKMSAVVLAILGAALVIIAGKSCADDAVSQNQKSKAHSTVQQAVPTAAPATHPPAPAAESPTAAPPATEAMYETVTNMLGDVIETIPITEAVEADVNATTETKSILEAYNELHEPATQEDSASATTTTYIEPATKIVINLG